MTAQHHIPSSTLLLSRPRGPSGGKFGENKSTTRLDTGDAATLGIMVFYNWREKRLAKDDPEGYARLQRLKAVFRFGEPDTAREKKTRRASSHPLHYENDRHKNPDARVSH